MKLSGAAWSGLFLSCALTCGLRIGKAQPVATPLSTTVSGSVLDPQGKTVPGASVKATDGIGRVRAQTKANAEGLYSLVLAGPGPFAFVADSSGFDPVATDLKSLAGGNLNLDLNLGQLAKAGVVMTVTERVVEPTVDQRDGEMFKKTLFTRDDQIFQSLGAGLSLGQHAGGGKSLEVRRFGFNLDHGGVGGGLRVVMDSSTANSTRGVYSALTARNGAKPKA